MTAIIFSTPLSSRAMNAGGITPMMKPMLGMKFVTKASTAQTKAPGMSMRYRTTPSMTATIRPKPAETPM